ncbi:MAG: ferritin-like protein, partial [Gemmatimonadaceae bacterium]
MSAPQIETIPDLQRHLQWAIELEHSTIPPYLCALYSIPDGVNVSVSALIRSVVMEEMLHMVLAANLLNAIGGKPSIDHDTFVPSYPTFLPHSDDAFKVELLPFGTRAIDTFLKIERPAAPGVKPKVSGYSTIGQFYLAILEAFKRLASTEAGARELFSGHRSRQVSGSTWYYGGGGDPIEVHDLATAKRAIEEIAEQGEGLDHTIFDGDDQFGQVDELAHYFRFYEIRCGRRYLPT